ncbi:hypothetical protein [Labrys monachus]|uniref:Carbamoyl-phosphate synthase large subunit n=1 Tax=Labrys monachus TaxID=217067 RepID=A0ABU0FIW5_9HYPH|nr:hypothetical protein [Labrys monachus]MDQ0394555.1 carbamoyl-phosphate synthase large subunit [Labrys monachus]
MPKFPAIAVSGLHRGDNPQPGSAVIRSIRRIYPGARIVGLSYDPLESGLFSMDMDNVDVAFSLPFPAAGEGALIDRIDEIRQIQRLDMIIPCLDAEIPNYFKLAKEFWRRRIKVTLPTKQSFERRSKENLSRLASEAGVGAPRTIVAPSLSAAYSAGAEIGYPLFLKGRFYDARRVSSPAEVAFAFHQLTEVWGGPVLVQEIIDGEEYDVAGFGNGQGDIVGSCSIRKMLLTKAGKAFSGIVVSDPQLNDTVKRIIAALRWNGPFELEFIKGRRGYSLIEMNPRFPAWIDFPSQLGCNLPAALVERAASLPETPLQTCSAGRMFVRHCVDLVGDITDLAELSVTGTLMRDQALDRSEAAE